MQTSIASEPTTLTALEASVDRRASRPRPMPEAQPLGFSEKKLVPWLLAAVDIACVQTAIMLGYASRAAAIPLWPGDLSGSAQSSLRLESLLVPVGCWLAGLYPGYGLAPVERLRKRVKSTVLAFCGLFAWDSLAHSSVGSRGVILATFLIAAMLAPMIETCVIAALVRVGLWGTPVLILSSEHAGSAMAKTLRMLPQLGLNPVGLFKNDADTWGTLVNETPVLGPPSIAGHFARRVSTALIAMPGLDRTGLMRTIEALPFSRVIVVPQLSGVQTLWVTTRDLGGALGLELQNNLHRPRNHYLKRSLDYALGIPLFFVSAPIIGALALWIKRVSPGPAFYSQERVGYRGQKVRVWKLRTMFPDAETTLQRYLAEHPEEKQEWLHFFKLKKDPRILPGVGRFLRATSLDELPQLWNVLRGELSLVGPRPFPVYHLDAFGEDFRELRHTVRPGITGLWQVSTRSDGDLAEQERLDTYYIRNWSPWLDIYILVRTIGVVVFSEGAY